MNDQDRFHHEVMSELEQEQWWEKNRRLLKGFEELRPIIGEYKPLTGRMPVATEKEPEHDTRPELNEL